MLAWMEQSQIRTCVGFLVPTGWDLEKNAPATIKEVNEQVAEISEKTGLSMAEVDNLIWSFCADGFGEICTATPRCGDCPIREFCHSDGGRP